MRTWVKVTLAGFAVCVLAFSVLAGAGAYLFFRHLETTNVAETSAKADFEAVRTKFAGRLPLIDVTNPRAGDIRVNRAKHPQGLRANTVYVMTWNAEDDQLLKTDIPLWMMRFSSINILSHLGIAPNRYRLTAEDVASFGPGIVVDYSEAGAKRVLIWVE
jgi:hypothetical protein